MAADDDTVSAVMAVRDGEQYLAEALDSILEQSVPPDEVVVVDDGSVDGTSAVLSAYGDALRVIQQAAERSGRPRSTPRVAAATGTVLAFLDADDTWEPDAQRVRLERLHQPDAPDAVFGSIVQFVSPELGPDAAAAFHFDPGPTPGTLLQAMVIRRAAFDRVGQLDTTLPSAANIDWMSHARVGRPAVRRHRRRRRAPAAAPLEHGCHHGPPSAQGAHRRRAHAPRAHARLDAGERHTMSVTA